METDELLGLVGPLATVSQIAAHTTIVQQGDPVDRVLFVADGEVALSLDGVPPVLLDRRGPGMIVGAEWTITGKVAACTVMATRETRLLAVTKESLFRLLAESQAFAQAFVQLSMAGELAVQQAAERMHRRTHTLEAYIARQVDDRYGDLLGSSRVMDTLRGEVRRQADLATPLLLTGERGVGKDLVAANIHLAGARQSEAFATIQASEWAEALWQEKVDVAAGGTILLRDIDQLPSEAVGIVRALCMDARPDQPRLIASTTVSPGQQTQNASPWDSLPALRIPPLRERKLDIPDLARAFLRALTGVQGATDASITGDAMRHLIAYPYLSANVSELKAIIIHAAHLAGGEPIRPEHLRLGDHGSHPRRPLLGVALGGGVVRGMAHIGVLQVLVEEGIAVDIVAGTSVGALVGAAFAGGVDLYALARLVPSLSWPKLVSPSWPNQGLLINVKLGRFLESLIGARQIEALPIRYAAVAVDQHTGDEVIIRDGPLSTAVRASAAIPGLFRPIARDGRLLIDGGLVNNVPASVVRSMGADVVIAVDVRDYNYFSAADGRGLMLSFLRGYDIMIHRAAQSELEWADVAILATKPGVNPYGFAMAKELIQAGREQAQHSLPAIRAALRAAEERVS